MTIPTHLRAITMLAICGLAPAAAAPNGSAPGELPALMARHDLVLVYREHDPQHTRAILPRLRDLAEVYGPAGLAVAVAGASGPGIERTGPTIVRSLADAGSLPPGEALLLYRGDGTVLTAMEPASLDLYAVYRICERELHGRARTTLYQHVEALLADRVARGAPIVAFDDGRTVPLGEFLRRQAAGCLLVPPGCGGCLLQRHAAAVGELITARPAIPALAFDPDAAEGLRSFGWTGPAFLLEDDAAARLLGLRQAGHYLPVLVTWSAADGVRARPLREGGAS